MMRATLIYFANSLIHSFIHPLGQTLFPSLSLVPCKHRKEIPKVLSYNPNEELIKAVGRCALGRGDGQTAPELGRAPERPPERVRTGASPKLLTVGQKHDQPPPEAARAGGGTEQPPWGGLDARGDTSTRPTTVPRAWLSCPASGCFLHDWLCKQGSVFSSARWARTSYFSKDGAGGVPCSLTGQPRRHLLNTFAFSVKA